MPINKEDIAPLRTSLQDKRMKLDEQFAQELEAAIARYKNPDGTYNWDNILEDFRCDPSTITSAQIFALSNVYLTMSEPEDINRFIYCGYIYNRADGYDLDNIFLGDYAHPGPIFLMVTEATRATVTTAIKVGRQIAMVYGIEEPDLSDYITRLQILDYAISIYSDGFKGHEEMDVRTPTNPWVVEYWGPFRVQKQNGQLVISALTGEIMELNPAVYTVGFENVGDYAIHWAEGNRPDDQAAFLDIAEDAMLSLVVSALLAMALPEVSIIAVGGEALITLADVVGTAIGVSIDIDNYYSESKAKNEEIDKFIAGIKSMTGIGLLGGEVITTYGKDGSLVINYINLNTTENSISTYGFLNTVGSGYELSKAELEAIILGGDMESEIYEAYADYVNDDGQSARYREGLNRILNPDGTPEKDRRFIEDCTPEEIRELTIRYNEREAAKNG